jgi:hypothetical protein
MIEIKTSENSNIIFTTASGKMEKQDYETLLPLAEAKIAQHGKERWYFEMDHFNGWHFDTFWRDVKFDLKHAHHFEKVAMVGDKKWQEWMSKSLKAFISADVRYFNTSEKQLADQWIRQ